MSASIPSQTTNRTKSVFLKLNPLLFAVGLLLGLPLAGAQAANWPAYKMAGFTAFDEGRYQDSLEQFESAIILAYDERAPAADLGGILENLATVYYALGDYRDAWGSIEQWDKLMARSAGEAWVAEQKVVRDPLARLISEALERVQARAETSPQPEPAVAAVADNAAAPEPAVAISPAAGPEPAAMEPAAMEPTTLETAAGPEPASATAMATTTTTTTDPPSPTQTAAAPTEESPAVSSPVPPVTGAYAVHLESAGIESNVEPSWNLLKATYPAQFADKSLLVKQVDLGDRGTFYRILAAPYADASAAGDTCRQLKSQGQYCAVYALQ